MVRSCQLFVALALAVQGGVVMAQTPAPPAQPPAPTPPPSEVRARPQAPLAAQGAATATTAPVAAAEQGPRWSSLTSAQRMALGPLQQDWHTIDASRKQKWLQVAGRMPSMSAEERQRITERMAEWARMSPQERGRARLQFLEAKQIPAEDRAARWEAYQALAPEKREALASRAAASGAAAVPAGPKTSPPEPKRNVVQAAGAPPARAVAPTVIQVRPGATTTLVSREVKPPRHQQPGQPKIAAASGAVDPATLLPRRGPQAAGAASRPEAGRPEAPAEPEPPSDS